MSTLEDNPRLIADLRMAARLSEAVGRENTSALLLIAADALEHTHEIACAGWLDTEAEARQRDAEFARIVRGTHS